MTGRGRNPGKRRIPDPNSDGALHVTDGQTLAGTVVRQADEWFAFGPDGTCLGVFDSAIEAARHIPAAGRAS
jgi:hypothetical protein